MQATSYDFLLSHYVTIPHYPQHTGINTQPHHCAGSEDQFFEKGWRVRYATYYCYVLLLRYLYRTLIPKMRLR
jgi:hypothetical protein